MRLVTRNKKISFSPQGVLAIEVGSPAPVALFDSIHKVFDQIRVI